MEHVFCFAAGMTKGKELVRAGAETTAAMSGATLGAYFTALAVGHPIAIPIAALAGVGAATQAIAALGFEIAERRRPAWVSGFRKALPAYNEATFEEDFVERLRNETFRERMYQSIRGTREALCDVVAPALGALACEYGWAIPPEPADRFFRGMLGLLESISAEEFLALHSFLRLADNVLPGDDSPMIEFGELMPDPETPLQVCIMHPKRDTSGGYTKEAVGFVPHIKELFHLFKTNGLGRENPGGLFGGGFTGPQFVTLERTVIKRMLKIVEYEGVKLRDD